MIMSATAAKSTEERRSSGYFYEPSFACESYESFVERGPMRGAAVVSSGRRGASRARMSTETSMPLLTPEEEQACFRQLNYLKYVLDCMTEPELCEFRGLPGLEMIDEVRQRLDETRERIIVGNLRLVFALARRVVPQEHSDFEELVSLGNEALMRACEKFDYRMGYRFSSYAYQAIKCAMFGWLRTERKKRERLPLVSLEFGELADESESSQFSEVDSVDDARVIANLLGRLDECDRRIVKARFGVDCPDSEPIPFRTISKTLGLSTTRVVQRFQRAMAKLQQARLQPT